MLVDRILRSGSRRANALLPSSSPGFGMMEIVNPATARPISTAVAQDPLSVAEHVESSRRVQRLWSRRSGTERGTILLRVAQLIDERCDDIVRLEVENTGKTIADAHRGISRAARTFRYYGGWADKVMGETIPVDTDHLVYTIREPFGVVAAIIPWNSPFFFAAKKIAPAIAFGNSCILKPAPETPLTALVLLDILTAAGVPRELVQVLVGASDLGAALVAHQDVDLISFTGSDATGKLVAAAAGGVPTPLALELGGKSAQILFEDADLETAIDRISEGIFPSAGQMCIAGSRLLVQESIYEKVVAKLAERVESLTVGDPRDPRTDVGPQTTRTQQQKSRQFIEEASATGTLVAQAKLPTASELREGFFVPPTFFKDVPESSRLFQEETFGPILAATPFRDEAHAVALANGTRYGLGAGIWTSKIGRAHSLARELRAGTVWINTYKSLSDLVPFGGIGASGYGRENGTEAVGLYTRAKSVWTSLNDEADVRQ